MGLCSCHWCGSSEQNGFNTALLRIYVLIEVLQTVNKYINDEFLDSDSIIKKVTAVRKCVGEVMG